MAGGVGHYQPPAVTGAIQEKYFRVYKLTRVWEVSVTGISFFYACMLPVQGVIMPAILTGIVVAHISLTMTTVYRTGAPTVYNFNFKFLSNFKALYRQTQQGQTGSDMGFDFFYRGGGCLHSK